MAATVTTDPLFDRWSRTYDAPGLQRSTYRPVHDAVLRRLQHVDADAVLDLGCGTGQFTSRLVDRFPDATVTGFDLSAGMLDEAADRVAGAALVRGDAMRLPFAEATFDVVVCTESFHWYEQQAEALAGIARCLRPDGRLLIASIATVTDVGDRLLRRASGAGGRTIRAVPPARLRRLLRGAGFEVLHQRRVPRPGPLTWPVLTDARLRLD